MSDGSTVYIYLSACITVQLSEVHARFFRVLKFLLLKPNEKRETELRRREGDGGVLIDTIFYRGNKNVSGFEGTQVVPTHTALASVLTYYG
jgi:hypothetical protein